MNTTLNKISDALDFDLGWLEIIELQSDRCFWDVRSWPEDRVDRSIRRLLGAGSNVTLSGVIDDGYNRRTFDIKVKPNFDVDFRVENNCRRFPVRAAVRFLA